jgi:hypothetical protein
MGLFGKKKDKRVGLDEKVYTEDEYDAVVTKFDQAEIMINHRDKTIADLRQDLRDDGKRFRSALEKAVKERDEAERKSEELTVENQKLQDKLNKIAEIELEKALNR